MSLTYNDAAFYGLTLLITWVILLVVAHNHEGVREYKNKHPIRFILITLILWGGLLYANPSNKPPPAPPKAKPKVYVEVRGTRLMPMRQIDDRMIYFGDTNVAEGAATGDDNTLGGPENEE